MRTLLVIDDDHDTRAVLRQILEAEGYQVLTAATGIDGLSILQKARPNLIILDLVMPLMSGEKFLELTQADPALRDIPVIILTAQAAAEDKQKNKFRVKALVVKPLNLKVLIDLVKTHCS